MFATILAIIISIILIAKGDASELSFLTPMIKFVISLIPLILFLLLNSSAWGALQKSEQNLTPRILQMFQSDWQSKWILRWLIVFPLIALIFNLEIGIPRSVSLSAWLVLLGVSLDLLVQFQSRLSQYLDPFSYVDKVVIQAKQALRINSNQELTSWIDALFEMTVKSIDKGAMALGLESISGLQKILAAMLDHGHFRMTNNGKAEEILQEVSYMLVYFLQRIEGIFFRALNQAWEPIATSVILLLGKAVLYGAKCDNTLALPPLHFIGKFAKAAQEKGMDEVSVKAALTLQQVGMTFFSDPELFSMPLKEIFFALINQLETLTKAAFKRDKTINIGLLMAPFKTLRESLQNEKIGAHPDAPAILGELDRVLGEFEALGLVLSTMPNIPGYHPKAAEKAGEESGS